MSRRVRVHHCIQYDIQYMAMYSGVVIVESSGQVWKRHTQRAAHDR